MALSCKRMAPVRSWSLLRLILINKGSKMVDRVGNELRIQPWSGGLVHGCGFSPEQPGPGKCVCNYWRHPYTANKVAQKTLQSAQLECYLIYKCCSDTNAVAKYGVISVEKWRRWVPSPNVFFASVLRSFIEVSGHWGQSGEMLFWWR